MAVLLCVTALASCSLNPSTIRGETVSSMEDCAEGVLAGVIGTKVSYRSLSRQAAGAEKPTVTTTILDARTVALEKEGELEGLTPKGVLELWRFQYLLRMAVDDPSDVCLPDGACEKEGWFDLTGQGGDYIIALRRDNGGYEILDSGGWKDGGDIYAYHNSVEEVLYDWYAATTGDSCPRYVMDWGEMTSALRPDWRETLPVHRYDGDGWYLYVPVDGWSRSPDGTGWQSAYGTGAALTVEKRAESPETLANLWMGQGLSPEKQGDGASVTVTGEAGRTCVRCCPASDGGSWIVTTVTPSAGETEKPRIGVEPTVLSEMAESFTVL